MPTISIEDLEGRRRQVEAEISRLVEEDISAVLSSQPMMHTVSVTRLGQDLNILSAAIERLRNAG